MSASTASTPSIKRRLIAMVYEAFLLLAVDMLAVALWMLVTRNSQAPVFQFGLKVYLFVVNGAYFVHAWSGSGHTLAMKTWRMRLACAGADAGDTRARVPVRVAILRYLLAWGWFLPAIAACLLLGLKDKRQIGVALALGIGAWALTALFGRDRQFLHDRLAGTRVVALPSRRGAPAEAEPLEPAA